MRAELSTDPRDMGKLLAQTVHGRRTSCALPSSKGTPCAYPPPSRRQGRRRAEKHGAAAAGSRRRGPEEEKRTLTARLETYRDLDRYVQHVSRFSLYTRTRMDYERSVMKLTPEQQRGA